MFVFSNFALSTLGADIGPDDVSLQLSPDDVARFPALIGGAKFPLVLADSDDITEIVYVTALSLGGVASVERGQEGTQAQSWLAGTLCRHTFTAATVIGAAGFRPKGAWSAATPYDPGDLVVSGNISYIAVLTSLNSAPSLVNPAWQVVYQPPGAASTAMNWQGRWNSGTTYAQGQVVEYQGRLWQANTGNTNSAPAIANPNWTHLAKWSGAAVFEAVLAFAGTNNYTATIAAAEAPPAYYDGMKVVGRFTNANTTSATLAVNALAAVPLRFKAGVEFGSGDIIPQELYEFVYLAGSNEFVSKLPPGIGNELAVIAAALAALATVPTGTIVDFGGSVSPAGWLLCDGAEFSRTGPTAALFAVIGTTYGVGNGTTTANLPDFRGRVAAMVPGGTGRIPTGVTGGFSGVLLGTVGGEATHSLQVSELPSHNHPLTDTGHTHATTQTPHSHTYNKPNVGYTVNAGVQQSVWISSVAADTTSAEVAAIAISANTTGISIAPTGGGQVHNVMQPTLLVNKIIKT